MSSREEQHSGIRTCSMGLTVGSRVWEEWSGSGVGEKHIVKALDPPREG